MTLSHFFTRVTCYSRLLTSHDSWLLQFPVRTTKWKCSQNQTSSLPQHNFWKKRNHGSTGHEYWPVTHSDLLTHDLLTHCYLCTCVFIARWSRSTRPGEEQLPRLPRPWLSHCGLIQWLSVVCTVARQQHLLSHGYVCVDKPRGLHQSTEEINFRLTTCHFPSSF